MDQLTAGYTQRCNTPSDIFEHLPTLQRLASECESVLECGVAGCVSSWALAHGLASNPNASNRRLGCCDIHPCSLGQLPEACTAAGINITEYWQNDLTINEEWDFVFIDSWHVYGQLIRELEHFAPRTRKILAMHDTTVDGLTSESVRQNMDIEGQMRQTGWPRMEIEAGLQPAIIQFLENHPEWEKVEEYTNNNGLTVLRRK